MKYSIDELYSAWTEYVKDKPAGTETIAFLGWLKRTEPKHDLPEFDLTAAQKKSLSALLEEIRPEVNAAVMGDSPVRYTFIPSALGTVLLVTHRHVDVAYIDELGNIDRILT